MVVRTASAEAYRNLDDSGERARKINRILEVVKKHPGGLTRREIEDQTGYRPNQVSGRVHELVKKGLLKEGAMRECSITSNRVNVVMAAEAMEA